MAVCPICGAPTAEPLAKSKFPPFCSARCKQVDLGKWLNADYGIPVSDDSADAEEELDDKDES